MISGRDSLLSLSKQQLRSPKGRDREEIMKIKALIGAGDQIIGCTLPFALIGMIMNIIYPEIFRMNLGLLGMILGFIFLIIGVPIWLTSAVQVLVNVPRNKLITTGPYAIVLHPLYSSVALLVILYIFSRLFSVKEDKKLNDIFSDEYRLYRSRVLLPWL